MGFIKLIHLTSVFWLCFRRLLVIVAVAFKLPAIPSLIGGVLIGVPFMFLNKAHIENAMVAAEMDKTDLLSNIFYISQQRRIHGYMYRKTPLTIISKLSDLLHAQAVCRAMMWTISIILCAMCFGGIVDCTGMMGSIDQRTAQDGKRNRRTGSGNRILMC